MWITTTYAWDASNASLVLTVSADSGNGYDGQPTSRSHTFRLPCTLPPTNVSLDGEPVPFAPPWQAASGAASWTYDGSALETVIHLPPMAVVDSARLVVRTPRSAAPSLSGLAGVIAASRRAKSTLDEVRVTPGAQVVDPHHAPLSQLAMAGDELAHLASLAASAAGLAAFVKAASGITALREAALGELKSRWAQTKGEQTKARLLYAVQLLEASGR